jgi:hypothetical protein
VTMPCGNGICGSCKPKLYSHRAGSVRIFRLVPADGASLAESRDTVVLVVLLLATLRGEVGACAAGVREVNGCSSCDTDRDEDVLANANVDGVCVVNASTTTQPHLKATEMPRTKDAAATCTLAMVRLLSLVEQCNELGTHSSSTVVAHHIVSFKDTLGEQSTPDRW